MLPSNALQSCDDLCFFNVLACLQTGWGEVGNCTSSCLQLSIMHADLPSLAKP